MTQDQPSTALVAAAHARELVAAREVVADRELVAAVSDSELAALAARYRRANSGVMRLLNGLGAKIEDKLTFLPESIRSKALSMTEGALEASYGAASLGGKVGHLGGKGHRALASVSGAVGGFGGMASSMAEIPVTITLILRAIQEVAESHGFDPKDEATRREVLRVFAAGSPMSEDDGINTAFIGARLTLTGPAIQGMISKVAPRIATALGQKLAAQAVPVLGAVLGAGLNFAYIGYYRELAEIRFTLLRMAERDDPEDVTRRFAAHLAAPKRR